MYTCIKNTLEEVEIMVTDDNSRIFNIEGHSRNSYTLGWVKGFFLDEDLWGISRTNSDLTCRDPKNLKIVGQFLRRT